MDDLVQRLDRLERENRRFKWVGSMVLVTIAAFLVMGQAKSSNVPKVIEAEKFVLRDKSGKVFAALQTEAKNEPALNLYDKNGKVRVTLGIMEIGNPMPHRFLYDANEKFRVKLAVLDDAAIMYLHDKDGRVLWSTP